MPQKGLKEGPYLFERNGIYYMTYPHVENKTERLEYAIADNPLGPFKFAGVIMDESPTGCWTNHHSFIQFKNQWYLFYHHNDLSPRFDKNRAIRVDSMFFEADGTIRKVIPTLRGVGLTDARKQIQIDRYSHISHKSASIAFLDTNNRFQGWKAILDGSDAWVQYNSVDFGKKKLKNVTVKAASATGGTVQLRLNSKDGPVIGEINIPKNNTLTVYKAPVSSFRSGIQNLFVTNKSGNTEIDWVSFE
jgi:hypothetical protein